MVAFRRGLIERPLLNGAATNRRQPFSLRIKVNGGPFVIPGRALARTRNLEIPGSTLRIAPE